MAKTDAERMREYRRRKRNAESVTGVTETERNVTEPEGDVMGPLDVYSEQRWAFLQSRGHVWDAARQRSFRRGPHGSQIRGVTAPGDPAYHGMAGQMVAGVTE
jgi:hypothetical protein